MRKMRRSIAAALATAAAVAAFAGPASALPTTGDQTVGGTTASTLSLGITTSAVALTGFAPGSAATGTGVLVVTSTNPWMLKVADGTANAGHLAQIGGSCTGSEASTVNALTVTTTGTAGNTSSAGAKTIGGGTGTIVANGNFADTLTNAYSLLLGNTETLLTGCIYGTTATYTVQ